MNLVFGGMARKPRIQYPGAVYHVMSRGGRIFKDRLDCEMYAYALYAGGMLGQCGRMT